MKQRLLYLACIAGMYSIGQNSAPAEPDHEPSQHPLDNPSIVQALLAERYGIFDTVAGQRHPMENIP